MREKLLFSVVGILFTCLVLPALAHAQAFTIPRSSQTVSGELILPDGWRARFTVRDGTWVTVEDHRKPGYFFGFIGKINEDTGNPNIVPHKISRTPGETEVVELDQTGFNSTYTPDPARDVLLGKTITFKSVKGLRLRVTGTGESNFAAPYITDVSRYSEEELEEAFGYTSSTKCCITCQGHTICASSVATSCGSCGWDNDIQ